MSWFGLEMIGLENKQEADLKMADAKSFTESDQDGLYQRESSERQG